MALESNLSRISMRKHPTKHEIVAALKRLADNMETVGAAMDYYGGFGSETAEHGREMVGAAEIARTWVEGLEGE